MAKLCGRESEDDDGFLPVAVVVGEESCIVRASEMASANSAELKSCSKHPVVRSLTVSGYPV